MWDCENHMSLDLLSSLPIVRKELRLTWRKLDGAPVLGTGFLLLLSSRAASSHFKRCFRQWRLCVCNRDVHCTTAYCCVFVCVCVWPSQTNIPQPRKPRCLWSASWRRGRWTAPVLNSGEQLCSGKPTALVNKHSPAKSCLLLQLTNRIYQGPMFFEPLMELVFSLR